mmetsp:Transcript_22447/g.33483  ORF Transcript_22447/g.33483 Transcript_22447/m.33483 type:complete len:354 (-) Transcript_22447:249-1310(-)|eukprot:CAMPEP_0167744472 /NCGR_PEP_ID=MMETSP0110_2-20121227/2612_1 /TAXON_ID=629695 /ORGANISM="Gymnochlora sp., Strain CCMP2014" /LENGTH=353 /DNA_ID=CAMNT_0007629001 /DNA_START=97 /DNA_END=1158 /DNA_ORIENTATION=+
MQMELQEKKKGKTRKKNPLSNENLSKYYPFGTLPLTLFNHQFHISEVVGIIFLVLAVIFVIIFFSDEEAIHGSVIAVIMGVVALLYAIYLWKYDHISTLSKLAAEYAMLAEEAEKEAEELKESNEKGKGLIEKIDKENKELESSIETLKKQTGLLDATQQELDKIEHEIEGMIDAQKTLEDIELNLNKENARFVLCQRQDELDRRRHRCLEELIDAFEDVDSRRHDNKLEGREIENMKRLIKRLPSLRETFVDEKTGKKESKMLFEVDWKKLDADNDGCISKWEFRSTFDALLSEHLTIYKGKFLEESKEAVAEFNIGNWWKENTVGAKVEDRGNWWNHTASDFEEAAKDQKK